MAENNIKDFTINWIVVGLLFFCLISFAIAFMYNNNPDGFGDSEDKFTTTKTNVENELYAVEGTSDRILNITANTNPEASQLGSRDSVAAAYETREDLGGWEQLQIFISWIFAGELGKMLLGVFGGIITFLSVYYGTKWFRTGT